MQRKYFLPVIALAGVLGSVQATFASSPLFPFTAPSGWTVGQSLSTYQEWVADPLDHIDGVPNVGFNDAGASITPPTLSAANTGFVASSGGFYSFSDTYTVNAALHAPTSGIPANAGTYLILQTFASIDPDDGAGHSGTVLGISLTDGTNALAGAEHVASSIYGFQSGFQTTMGPVDVQATIDEYWIPNFTGNVTAIVSEIIHSSFMGMRVDSILSAPGAGGTAPFSATAVPEPASLSALLVGGGLLLARCRNRHR